ncbi:hypothetical protein [Kutzneria sp. NPDC052558]|uniref:hypothetical protein n=1 Tax=Kutzneria sp. NPDC052558 TaxID=3364121 RepID=UPI0037C9A782
MTTFTFVPTWVVQDLVVYVLAAIVIAYIVRREPHPAARAMELCSFTLLYSAVFENAATLAHLYTFGQSLVMVFNVPLSVPVFEAILTYSTLRVLAATRMPTWLKPLTAGLVAIVADFSLDTVAVKDFHDGVARWTWHTPPGHVMIYDEPVSNFTGWAPLVGYAATFFLLGRWWHRKSGYAKAVGYVYPVAAALAALLCMFSPITSFLLYLTPFFAPGSPAEVVMLAVLLVVPAVLLALFWRGRMSARLSLADDLPIFLVIGGVPVVNLVFCVVIGATQILWLVTLAGCVLWAALAGVYAAGQKVDGSSGQRPRPTAPLPTAS